MEMYPFYVHKSDAMLIGFLWWFKIPESTMTFFKWEMLDNCILIARIIPIPYIVIRECMEGCSRIAYETRQIFEGEKNQARPSSQFLFSILRQFIHFPSNMSSSTSLPDINLYDELLIGQRSICHSIISVTYLCNSSTFTPVQSTICTYYVPLIIHIRDADVSRSPSTTHPVTTNAHSSTHSSATGIDSRADDAVGQSLRT